MVKRETASNVNYAAADGLFAELISKLAKLNGDLDEKHLRAGYEFALSAHEGQLRRDGTPFIIHPLEVARTCADLNMDGDAIIAALLHDTVEDTNVKLNEIERNFGNGVAEMVDSLTKIMRIDLLARFTGRGKASGQASNLQKLFIAMTKDTRVIVIKLADRLHNMQTLVAMSEHQRQRISLETLEFYIPIARRLGLGLMVRELEDLVFAHLYPEEFSALQQAMEPVFKQYEQSINNMKKEIRKLLEKEGIQLSRIYGRRKHLYSIHRKMHKYMVSSDEVKQRISDLLAIRIIIVGGAYDCYRVLGLIHLKYKPIFDRFRDYVASPKNNGYRTLHTTVFDDEGFRVELQIRTEEMELEASKGIAAHWRYKETGAHREHMGKDDAWLDFIRELDEEHVDSKEFVESTRQEFQDQVLTLSPMGEVVSLPVDSTPIDFAYYIHTQLGHSIRGALVNGVNVPLDQKLDNGDIVEVIKGNDSDDQPRPEWLAMVASPKSTLKLRNYYKRRPRAERVQVGRTVLRSYITREGLYPLNLTANDKLLALLRRMPVRSIDELYDKVALGLFKCSEIVGELKEIHRSRVEMHEEREAKLGRATALETAPVDWAVELGVSLAGRKPLRKRAELMSCCTPVPGDRIYGVWERGNRRVSVHRVGCNVLQRDIEDSDLIELGWLKDDGERRYPTRIEIVSFNRVGLLFEAMRVLSRRNINLGGADFAVSPTVVSADRYAHFSLVIEVESVEELESCMSELAKLKDVQVVRRLFKAPQEAATEGQH